jgi:hypothetical protein
VPQRVLAGSGAIDGASEELTAEVGPSLSHVDPPILAVIVWTVIGVAATRSLGLRP